MVNQGVGHMWSKYELQSEAKPVSKPSSAVKQLSEPGDSISPCWAQVSHLQSGDDRTCLQGCPEDWTQGLQNTGTHYMLEEGYLQLLFIFLFS